MKVNPSPPIREHLRVRDRLRDWAAKRLISLAYIIAPPQTADHLEKAEMVEIAQQFELEGNDVE